MKTSTAHRKVKTLLELQRRIQTTPGTIFTGLWLEFERKPTGHQFRSEFLAFLNPKDAFHRRRPVLRISMAEILEATRSKSFLP